jgi:hypothetical protein
MLSNIDWGLTKLHYDITPAMIYLSNRKVIYKCPNCGGLKHLLYKDVKRKQYPECLKCIAQKKEYRDKISLSSKNTFKKDISLRAKIRDRAIANWDNKKYKMQDGLREKWKDQKFVEQKRIECIARNKILWSNDRLNLINKIKSTFTQDRLVRMSENSKRLWILQSYRDKTVIAINMPDNLARISDFSRKRWLNQDYKDKMSKIRLGMPKTSSAQIILYSLLDDLNIKFFNDKSNESKIGYYCFDCRIDPQFGLKKTLLIEVQGDYWHNLPRTINKDKSKATYLRTYFPEYDLKYLWEHEFNNKDRIRNLIKYWLGISEIQVKNFDFNDIQRRIVDSKQAELFVSKYHYAGRIGRSGLNFGYFLNDVLIGLIIYVPPIRQEVAIKQGLAYKEVLELSRLVVHPEYQIKNLASFLIANSIHEVRRLRPEVKLLVSFADSTYNHSGIIYKASNWKLDGEVESSYWYADDKGYICHKKTLWNHAKKMSMTESEYCNKYNYMKVFGEKKFRYKYDLC